MKKGCKFLQEHIINRSVLGLGGHWSGKTSLANMNLDVKSESKQIRTGVAKEELRESIPGRGKQSVKGYVVGRDYRTF